LKACQRSSIIELAIFKLELIARNVKDNAMSDAPEQSYPSLLVLPAAIFALSLNAAQLCQI
jgi:hypothetical protein